MRWNFQGSYIVRKAGDLKTELGRISSAETSRDTFLSGSVIDRQALLVAIANRDYFAGFDPSPDSLSEGYAPSEPARPKSANRQHASGERSTCFAPVQDSRQQRAENTCGDEGREMCLDPSRDVSSLDEQAEFHVLRERVLGEVRAGDKEALAVRDRALSVQ